MDRDDGRCTSMTKTGDRIELAGRKVGQGPRVGTVEEIHGSLLTVRWDSGERTSFTPGAGSMTVLGAVPKRRRR